MRYQIEHVYGDLLKTAVRLWIPSNAGTDASPQTGHQHDAACRRRRAVSSRMRHTRHSAGSDRQEGDGGCSRHAAVLSLLCTPSLCCDETGN